MFRSQNLNPPSKCAARSLVACLLVACVILTGCATAPKPTQETLTLDLPHVQYAE